jgi:UDP-N-acetylmuramyl pentapeptide phosphotransferase/UDP-N-acetylglucosamine-1-phosphate transferase
MTLSSTELKEIRKFGIVAFIFFGALSALGLWNEKYILGSFFCLLSVIGLGFILDPFRFKPVHQIWMKAAHFIGKLITTAVLILTYYAVITPAALLKRIFGGRPLPLTPDKKASSYWVARTEPSQPRDRFLKQF